MIACVLSFLKYGIVLAILCYSLLGSDDNGFINNNHALNQ